MFEPRTPVPNSAVTHIESDPSVATGLVSSYGRNQKVASINKLKGYSVIIPTTPR